MIQISTNGMVRTSCLFSLRHITCILVGIFGPPDTLYEGGYFKADMEFPPTYPFEPPKVGRLEFSAKDNVHIFLA